MSALLLENKTKVKLTADDPKIKFGKIVFLKNQGIPIRTHWVANMNFESMTCPFCKPGKTVLNKMSPR